MSARFGHAMLEHWAFEPGLLYLNHGTVGATPRRVLAEQQRIRDEIERCPARFMLRELADLKQVRMRMEPRTRAAAAKVGEFVGARGEDLVFVDNTTTGIAAVLASLAFSPGDEVLLTDHGYGAVERAALHVTARAGAVVRTFDLPWPRYDDDDAIVAAFAGALTSRTKLAVVDHVTSGSALVLPVERMAHVARNAGVPLLVDGAHAPGMLALNLRAIGADWWIGNLHKWAMAPRGCGILWTRPERQAELHPAVISWGLGLGVTSEFDWTGTRDPSAMLAAPEGLAFLRDLGPADVRAWNHSIAWGAACALAQRWRVELPMRESQVGAMVTIPLPERFGTTPEAIQSLKDDLLYDDAIEVQMHAWKGRGWIRISGQVYVEPADIERLARAMEARR